MAKQQQPRTATVLRFDAHGRRSSRRTAAAAARIEQVDAELSAAEKAEARALGITVAALAADPDLYAHAHFVRRIEAAYQNSRDEGRGAVLAALLEEYEDGYNSGLEDAAMPASGRR